MTTDQSPVAVIVAAFDEEKYILDTLRALDDQRFDSVLHRRLFDGFRVIVVDNNSTDRTADIVREHIASGPRFPVELISEKEKGTGSRRHRDALRDRDRRRVHRPHRRRTLPERDWLAEILRPALRR